MTKYPGYELNDPDDPTKGGKIGDVEVVFDVTPTDDNAYQNKLDEALIAQADAAADDKVDMFLCEADYAKKYVAQGDYVLDVKTDLGLTDDELSTQLDYTKGVMTDENGQLRGVSWQVASAGMIYRRDMAEEVFGVSEPEDVQALFSDWSKYEESAKKLADAGKICNSAYDTFRIYSNNAADPFVVDQKVNVSDDMKAWVDQSKELIDAKAVSNDALWSDEWAAGKQTSSNVFAYFGPAWFFNFCLDFGTEGTVATDGNWGFIEGPQNFYWGGTWICGVNGTDNADLVADIMRKLTCDADVMKDMAVEYTECVNNTDVLTELANSDEGNVELLGGQNPYQMMIDIANGIDTSNMTAYDQACIESFQGKMKDYFSGESDYDTAVAAFKSEVVEKHPDLSE